MLHFAALWLLVHVGGRLPLGILEAAARAGGTAAWWASRRLREVTRDHMRHVLGVSATPRDIDRAARECVRTAARGYAEFAHLPRLSPDAVRARVVSADGMEALAAAHAEGHGVIIMSAHLGAPEVISRTAPTFNAKMAGIAEPLRPQRVHDFVQSVRAVPGVPVFAATLAGLREARAHLAGGGALGILVDRDVLHTGHPHAFFGERALMPTGAVEIARRSGAPIVAVWCYRDGRPGRYRLVGRRVELPPATGDREADVESGMRATLAALEAAIRAAPGQWFPLAPVWDGLAADRPAASSDRAARLQ
jgi:KDO2-lipid IV(A) lauroyltransferase